MTKLTLEQVDELHTKLLREWNESVTTWDDFFEEVQKRMRQFQKCHCPDHALNALYTMYSFIIAMRENPDEGDIKVLTSKMAYIMAHESVTKLGAELDMQSQEEIAQQGNVSGLASQALMSSLLNVLAGQGSFTTPEDAGVNAEVIESDPAKKLH